MSNTVIEGSKDGYPELEEKKDFIFNVLTQEESKFNKTIDQGLTILAEMEAVMEKEGKKGLDGKDPVSPSVSASTISVSVVSTVMEES